MKVAFVGLGNMGSRMALNLKRMGVEVVGCDASSECRDALQREGIPTTGDISEAVAGCDALITMLPDGSAASVVWSEALPAMRRGSLAIDSSTIDVATARRLHESARTAGILSLDAPVSGGVEGAAAATLTFMVGGDPDAFSVGEPLLRMMGRRIIHCGAGGNGQAAKLCNNMLLGISMIGVGEAFNLAQGLGLSAQCFFDVASTSSGSCYALTTHCPVPGPVPTSAANFDYQPGFGATLMTKDLCLAQSAATDASVDTPLGAAGCRS